MLNWTKLPLFRMSFSDLLKYSVFKHAGQRGDRFGGGRHLCSGTEAVSDQSMSLPLGVRDLLTSHNVNKKSGFPQERVV